MALLGAYSSCMKQAHSFLLGGLTATLIIACSGSSDGGAEAGKSIKLDSSQVNQIVSAIKGAKWEYRGATAKDLKKLGQEGWEVITYEPSKQAYFLKKRID